jgi:hypothetical protein
MNNLIGTEIIDVAEFDFGIPQIWDRYDSGIFSHPI